MVYTLSSVLLIVSLLGHHLSRCEETIQLPKPSTSATCSSSGALCSPYVESFQGPLLNDILADPSILQDGDTYYAYATEHEKVDINVPWAYSKNGLRGDWHVGHGDVMPRNSTGLGAWTIEPNGDSGLWNPDVSKLVSKQQIGPKIACTTKDAY